VTLDQHVENFALVLAELSDHHWPAEKAFNALQARTRITCPSDKVRATFAMYCQDHAILRGSPEWEWLMQRLFAS